MKVILMLLLEVVKKIAEEEVKYLDKYKIVL
jgi:hypothetical protein